MQRHDFEKIQYLTFPELPLKHAFFLRHGGVSSNGCSTLNCGSPLIDLEKNITKNRKKALQALNLKNAHFIKQIHSTHVYSLTNSTSIQGIEGDGLITNEPGIVLATLSSDCQIALFFDPIKKVIANVHAGWRGQLFGIYEKTISLFTQKYGSQLGDIQAFILPSLGPDAAEFKNYKEEFPIKFWDYALKNAYFNLWNIARDQLIESGLSKENIYLSEICTYSNPQDFFSFRRDPKCGRHLTVISL